MARTESKFPTIAEVVAETDGTVNAYDSNGRPCWNRETSERVVLKKDLRRNGPNLYRGQLGWTVPETTDGYKETDVVFDTGQRLRVFTYTLQRVLPERAAHVSESLVGKYRNTRFDADLDVAKRCRNKWANDHYGNYISLEEMIVGGEGDEEVYAYTYPSLRELAAHRGEEYYPVKIGYTRECDEGSLGRVRQQIMERAGYPEKPVLLLVQQTWEGRKLETIIHRCLRELKRKVVESLGREWYLTSKDELNSILKRCPHPPLPTMRPAKGAHESMEECFNELLKDGRSVEFSMDPGTACIRMNINDSQEEIKDPSD